MPSTSSIAAPKLTVMISAREGHALAPASLASVLADTSASFDLVYIDIASPPPVAAALAETCAAHGGRLVRHEAWIAPAAARKAALDLVTTPYVAFLDNDIAVEPGCLGRLLACAEETGAALVAPLYFEWRADGAAFIHCAGGVIERAGDGPIVAEAHRLAGADVARAAELARTPVDYAEYHCALARTEFVRSGGAVSDDVLLLHEHIDLALTAQARGLTVWLEPRARVIYPIDAPHALGDVPFFLRRWDEVACEASLAAFARRWRIADETAFFAGVRAFRAHRWRLASPYEPGIRRPALDLVMAAVDLAENRTALRDQAAFHGYDGQFLRALEAALDYATLIFDGLYRPDGRPFLNHAIGTASALIRYGMRSDLVLAGVLHAAYSHRPSWIEPAEVSGILASGGETVERIVRAQPQAKTMLRAGADVASLRLDVAWALAVQAANEADMNLSGEYRATSRPPEIEPPGHALLAELLGFLGAPGLAATAALAQPCGGRTSILGFDALTMSFRLDAKNRRLGPAVASN